MAPSSVAAIVAASASAGVVVGWFLRTFMRCSASTVHLRHRSRASSFTTDDGDDGDETDEDIPFSTTGDYKMVIVIRNDLKMGKGKIAAQSCHAACGSVRRLIRKDPEILQKWEWCGQPKIVTKVECEEDLLNLAQRATDLGLPSQVIRDAGRTQIAPGSLTALAIGPGPSDIINQVTGHLKLL